ncbi:MAG: pilus assembly PilX N-terminal domain-containing protein [Patescibacteria group bacterium]|mgnify:CR=1 FL=1
MINKFTINNLQLTIKERGQALVTLLFFVVIATIITSAAVIMIIGNSESTSKTEAGINAYYIAESGIENALLRLLRDPNYTGETNLAVGDGIVDITVSGSNPKTVVATASAGNFKRTVQAEMNYSGGYYTFSNWKEI